MALLDDDDVPAPMRKPAYSAAPKTAHAASSGAVLGDESELVPGKPMNRAAVIAIASTLALGVVAGGGYYGFGLYQASQEIKAVAVAEEQRAQAQAKAAAAAALKARELEKAEQDRLREEAAKNAVEEESKAKAAAEAPAPVPVKPELKAQAKAPETKAVPKANVALKATPAKPAAVPVQKTSPVPVPESSSDQRRYEEQMAKVRALRQQHSQQQ